MSEREALPLKLYRYQTLDYLEPIIGQSKLYFSGRRAFNDPFDCRLSYSAEGTLDEFRGFLKERPNLLDRLMQACANKSEEGAIDEAYQNRERILSDVAVHALADFVDVTGVCCFTTARDNALMWSHYADRHRGVCLEFSTGIGEFTNPHLIKVQYGTAVPEFRFLNSNYDQLARDALGRKSEEWKGEDEWRLICIRGAYCSRLFAPAALTGVILGARMPAEDQAKVKAWCGRRETQARIYFASEQKDRFGLDIKATKV